MIQKKKILTARILGRILQTLNVMHEREIKRQIHNKEVQRNIHQK